MLTKINMDGISLNVKLTTIFVENHYRSEETLHLSLDYCSTKSSPVIRNMFPWSSSSS